MRTLLPLFPLPNVVLFPGIPLPLHIFEPRYRQMVADALAGDRRLGMVLLQPGWEADYAGRPPIFPIGCSGVIVHASKLDDGRYNIVLNGVVRVRVIQEDHALPYRRATVETWPDGPVGERDRHALVDLRARLDVLAGKPEALAPMPDAEYIHALAHAFDLEPLEKQALLERETLRARAESLIDLLEMRRAAATAPAMSNRPQ
jgi:Lon protease-like protein